jgi:transcriptional regulator with XRE-family HTH domain
MSLGKNIRRMRRDKGWTQGQLADRAGLKLNHVSKLEQDATDPKLSTLYKLMQAFSCSPDSLLMDLNRVSTDAVLKQTLERATALPDDDKLVVIKVVDGYCMAVGLRQQFNAENKRPFGLTLYTEPPTGVLDERDATEREAKS